VRDLFDRLRPGIVVHLAAQAGVRYSLTHPQPYIQSNLVGFANILECARQCSVGHLVYASSSSVYGECREMPFRESQPTDSPVSLYAATKKANELMAHAYSHVHGLRATGLRFFTVYGPWGRPDMAYFSFAEKIHAGKALPVFAEGKLQRDFTYIDDIVEGVVRLALSARPDGAPAHEVFNIGNHTPVTVLEFIRTLSELMGRRPKLQFLPMQPGDVPVTCADVDKLHARVGFQPSTPLRDGLARFVEWFRDWKARNG
jgi:UDP-glucuronate 4-epimerase